ncbi:MAG TPA: erythromycin biosynthesis sensory transduction protein eryC1 [Microscillaceae bacterium]|nr:erythromycin biosynthesis sensory transduction protein eryC1 [Microscillaceae bacterium]
MHVPFVDLKAQYLSIKEEIDSAIAQVLQNTSFIGGETVRQFEKAFAEYIGINHCISCGNGTDAIEILLQAMGIGEGDEVIVPAISWIATSEAVSTVGATPVFVDIEPEFYTLDPAKIEEKITSKTKAIIPVHLYGQPANMPAIMEIAQKYQLKVLEDCAQAHGATIAGKTVGTWGDCGTFSFYPGKNLGAYGDAGAMITNDPELAEKARRIGNHGQLTKHDHTIEGRNSRLDTLQAAILSVKLQHLATWTQARQAHALHYTQLLSEAPVETPQVRENAEPVYHLYVVRSKMRDELRDYLKTQGIATGIHYPIALPLLPCYQKFQHTAEDFPVASQYQQEILSLPIFAELTKEQMEQVAQGIHNFAVQKSF